MTEADRWLGPDGILDRLRDGVMGPASDPGTRGAAERYEIRRKIGEGAMADVYEAQDRQLGRRVALKKPKEFALADAQIRTRFEREARSSARLSHPNVVQVHDVVTEGSNPFLVMEFIDGAPLNQHLRERAIGFDAFLALMEKVARAVQYVHEQGVVHRDLKPGNILVTREGEPKVADFGLAHWLDSEFRLTRSGSPLGTPLYMAPEQVDARGGAVDPRTDVYALGAILYEGATGRPPHDAKSLTGLYALILNSDPAPARSIDPKLPPDLDRILSQALAKDADRRYPSALALAEDIARLRRGEPVLAKPPGALSRAIRQVRRRSLRIAAVAIVVAATAFGTWQLVVSSRRAEAEKLLELARTSFESANRFPDMAMADVAGMNAALDEAARRAEEAGRLAPGQAAIPHLLGRVRVLQGRPEEAVAAWRRAIALDPGFGPAHFELGRHRLVESWLLGIRVRAITAGASSARRKTARELADEALREIGISLTCRAPVRDEVAIECARVMKAYAADQPEEVVRLAGEAMARVGGRPGAEELLWLKALASPGRAALALMDDVIRQRPGIEIYLYTRAIYYAASGNDKAAMADYDEAIRRNPRFTDALHNRGVLRGQAGRREEARRDLDAALAVDPTRESTWCERGGVRFAMEDNDGAIADCERAVALDPTFAKAWKDLALIRAGTGDREGGLRDLDEAVRQDPTYAMAWFNRARLRIEVGRIDEAAPDLDRAIQLEPEWHLPYGTRGWWRQQKGNLAGAAEDYVTALRLAPPGWEERPAIRKALAEVKRLGGEEH